MKTHPDARDKQRHNTPESPLGRRELQRLRGALLSYRDGKDYIRELVTDSALRKQAIERLYKLSGGSKWLRPERVKRIALEVGDAPATLTTDQLGDALLKTVQQMTPDEKAELRRHLDAAFGVKLPLTTDDEKFLQQIGVAK
jgi:hypothetical protein